MPYFLPDQMALYRKDYPAVTFSIKVRVRSQVECELAGFSSDLALVFEAEHRVDFDVMHSIPQAICAVFSADHPLADKPNVRLKDCLEYPHILPASDYGVPNLLDRAAKAQGRSINPVVETESFELIRHYVRHEQVVGFQMPIGSSSAGSDKVVLRELPFRDVPLGHLLLGQLKGRVLPVATARFAMQLSVALEGLGWERAGVSVF